MRRLMLLMFAVGLLGSLVGCRGINDHGICDCEDDNHCETRAPWLHHAPANIAPAEGVGMPLPLPKPR